MIYEHRPEPSRLPLILLSRDAAAAAAAAAAVNVRSARALRFYLVNTRRNL